MIPALAPHQVAAVERIISLLDRRGGALLADEVGLGKSWVAAAVAKAMSAHSTIELIVPRALVQQWRLLANDFDLDAELITHDSLYGKFAYPGSGEPRLLIVDEAHRFRNPATNRHRGLTLRSVGNRLLLVTATPICNRLEDLYALVRLLIADDALSERGVLSVEQAFNTRAQRAIDLIMDETVVRRSHQALPMELQFGGLRREVIHFNVPELRSALATLQFPLIAEGEGQCAILRQHLWRRLESSNAALLDSVRRQRRFYHRARESLDQGLELRKKDYRRIFGADDDEVLFQDLLFRELWAGHELSSGDALPQIDRELASLRSVESMVRAAPDGKMELLLGILGKNAAEQILVFTGAVATAREIFRACSGITRAALLTSQSCCAHGYRNLTFDQVLDCFRTGQSRILVLTDLGAEGLNLQNAGMVIHYDMPWNPVRMDQRNGRIHRIGQARKLVRAIYFLPRRRCDRIVMRRISSKNRLRRSVLSEHSGRTSFGQTDFDRILRPRLTRAEPQFVLFSRLASEHALSPSLAELLMQRYRHGVELVMRQMSSEYIDSSRLRDLETMLRRERQLTVRDSG